MVKAMKLKTLIENNPEILQPRPKAATRQTRHFAFTPVVEGDPISMVLCGAMQPEVVKHNVRGVTCPDCLATLDELAQADTHEAALAIAQSRVPAKIIKPDPEIMEEKHGDQPTRRAMKHQRAFAYLKSRLCEDPAELPTRMVGADPATLLKNLYEIGLIDDAGESTGIPAAELAAGRLPVDDGVTE